jgi:xenotropic and polytropic retrovirus receptor 1
MPAQIARGDKKKAMARLRGSWRTRKTHHFSTFRAGMFVGLALPAFIDGLVKSKYPVASS